VKLQQHQDTKVKKSSLTFLTLSTLRRRKQTDGRSELFIRMISQGGGYWQFVSPWWITIHFTWSRSHRDLGVDKIFSTKNNFVVDADFGVGNNLRKLLLEESVRWTTTLACSSLRCNPARGHGIRSRVTPDSGFPLKSPCRRRVGLLGPKEQRSR
jgi:hypothetical protein